MIGPSDYKDPACSDPLCSYRAEAGPLREQLAEMREQRNVWGAEMVKNEERAEAAEAEKDRLAEALKQIGATCDEALSHASGFPRALKVSQGLALEALHPLEDKP